MLGRVISIAMVLAWSANPIGVIFLIALVFRVASPLGHAERYLSSSAGAAAK